MKERFVVNKWYYKFNDLNRGDIVVFENPDIITIPDVKYILKRCVGIPNDKIEIKEYQLYVNDKLISDYNIQIKTVSEQIEEYKNQHSEINKITKYSDDKYLYEMFKAEKDYINYGPVIVEENTFFCLGDNRTNSMDSRNWGLISKESLLGKAAFIYWSSKKSKIGSKL